MNKRNKIIVSIVGITIVLLALLGITYAYYLTRIQGNTNSNSISITTANLSLTYGDGTTEILTSDTLLMPGEFEGTKDFTVTNNGNASVTYGVILEDMINPLSRPEDMKMTLSCSSNKVNVSCVGLNEMNLPSTNEFLVENTIEVGETHTYELKLRYIEAGEDQSIDMGKTISGKVNIIDSHDTVDMTGVVANYEEGDYVQVNSEPKISYITKDGKYKVVGLKPEQHTIAVYKSDGSLKGTKELIIKSGTSESISENEITITKDTRTIRIDVTAINNDSTITTGSATLDKYNPFNQSTLAFEIYNNSKTGVNGTYFTTQTKTEPAKEGASRSQTDVYGEVDFVEYNSSQHYYYLPADSKNYNDATSPSVCTDDMIGGYVSFSGFYPNDEYSTEPNYDYAYSVIGCNEKGNPVINAKTFVYERELSLTEDEYGTSYYYRGYVLDNYLNYAGMCWRIVRIEGDGSIKIILEDKDNTCPSTDDHDYIVGSGSYGYTTGSSTNGKTYYKADYKKSDFMNTILNNWLDDSLIDKNQLKLDKWCLGNFTDVYDINGNLLNDTRDNLMYSETYFYYEPYIRLKGINNNAYATLRCDYQNYESVDSYIATLSADEVAFAGMSTKSYTSYTYLYDIFQEEKNYYYYLLTASNFSNNHMGHQGDLSDNVFHINTGNYLHTMTSVVNRYSNVYNFRPAITLKSGTKYVSGDGTKTNPYVIE